MDKMDRRRFLIGAGALIASSSPYAKAATNLGEDLENDRSERLEFHDAHEYLSKLEEEFFKNFDLSLSKSFYKFYLDSIQKIADKHNVPVLEIASDYINLVKKVAELMKLYYTLHIAYQKIDLYQTISEQNPVYKRDLYKFKKITTDNLKPKIDYSLQVLKGITNEYDMSLGNYDYLLGKLDSMLDMYKGVLEQSYRVAYTEVRKSMLANAIIKLRSELNNLRDQRIFRGGSKNSK